ncbi:MAG: hypothetical protein ACR2OA_21930 [Rubripirellula sp.]|jgi:hypothetical protein
MPSRILLITVFCITLCFAAVASAQNGRFLSNRRYSPSTFYSTPVARNPRLSAEQMDRIYGPSILVTKQLKPTEATPSFVVQPR